MYKIKREMNFHIKKPINIHYMYDPLYYINNRWFINIPDPKIDYEKMILDYEKRFLDYEKMILDYKKK